MAFVRDDPSPGTYRRVLDTTGGLPDNVVWQGDVKTFRTGPWNGLWFSGIPEVLTYSDLIEYQMEITPRQVTYGYVVKPGLPYTYVVLTDTGMVKRLVWDTKAGAWQTFYQGPRDVCDVYGKCGAFGLCNASAAATSFCGCLRGFSPASTSAWNVRDTSGGCRRNVELDCGSGSGSGRTTTTDGFLLVHAVKLPDTHNATVDRSITVEECRARCLANCSCLAYAAADIRGGGGGTGCVMWTDDIMDLRYVDQGQDMYLRLAQSELPPPPPLSPPQKKVTTAVTAGASAAAVVAIVIALLTLVVVAWKKRWRRHRSTVPGKLLHALLSIDHAASYC